MQKINPYILTLKFDNLHVAISLHKKIDIFLKWPQQSSPINHSFTFNWLDFIKSSVIKQSAWPNINVSHNSNVVWIFKPII